MGLLIVNSLVFFLLLLTSIHGQIVWNGNWAYACDWHNNDYTSVLATSAACGPICDDIPDCTHFTWTNYQGGTCWLKDGDVTQADAYYTGNNAMICGISENNNNYVYSLKTSWQGSSFFSGWNFFTSADPTSGFVNYTDYHYALEQGYISTTSNTAYIGCDHTHVATSAGRNSVRMTTQAYYNTGLFVISLSHMPYGCGTWPAFWMVGPNWPNDGEIDIIEGVNLQTNDISTLHTSNGCDQTNQANDFTGTYQTGTSGQPAKNCYVNAANQYSNQGCGITSDTSYSYGEKFNANGGGVYATQILANSGIRIWFWTMSEVPSDITNNNPNPNSWGTPDAAWTFGSWCPYSHFQDLSLVFDLTFCGSWAGEQSVWDESCSSYSSTCVNYVQYNPSGFSQAYWNINYVKYFE